MPKDISNIYVGYIHTGEKEILEVTINKRLEKNKERQGVVREKIIKTEYGGLGNCKAFLSW